MLVNLQKSQHQTQQYISNKVTTIRPDFEHAKKETHGNVLAIIISIITIATSYKMLTMSCDVLALAGSMLLTDI